MDAGVLVYFSKTFFDSLYICRVFSFSIAVLVTWTINRIITFSDRRAEDALVAEYSKYMTVQVVGAVSNLAVFYSVLYLFHDLVAWPVVALAIGAIFGLVVNFTGLNLWVYADKNLSDERKI